MNTPTTVQADLKGDLIQLSAGGVTKTFRIPPEVRYIRPWFDARGRLIGATADGKSQRLEEVPDAL